MNKKDVKKFKKEIKTCTKCGKKYTEEETKLKMISDEKLQSNEKLMEKTW